jgi:hypothetical protein
MSDRLYGRRYAWRVTVTLGLAPATAPARKGPATGITPQLGSVTRPLKRQTLPAMPGISGWERPADFERKTNPNVEGSG